jgi:Hypoxia induced protein conserved region
MRSLLEQVGPSLQRAKPGARAQPPRRVAFVPLSAPGKEDYMSAMESLLTVLVLLAMAATLVVLGFGLVQLVRGGNPRRSNKLMQYRVLFQGLALLLFAFLMMVFKH